MRRWSSIPGLHDIICLTLVGSVLVLLIGCTPAAGTASPTSAATDAAFGSPFGAATTPLSDLEDVAFDSPVPIATVAPDRHRSMTALASLPVALAAAREWNPGAAWYGIVPYTAIERAFALPLDDTMPSWFFRFHAPGATTEYVVEILDGKFRGANETSLPEYSAPSLDSLWTIDPTLALLDSVDVLKKYESRVGEGNDGAFIPDFYDFTLVHPKDKPNPIWTLLNAQDLTEPLLIMDAVTGEVIAEP